MGERRAYGLMLVFIATLLWGLAGLFIRMTELDLWSIVFWRSVFASGALALISRFQPGRAEMTFGWTGVIAAVISGVSTTCYVAAVTLTTVANVLVIYATIPFIGAGLAWLVMGERTSRRVLAASCVSLLGVVILGGLSLRPGDLAGNALALLMVVTFGVLLIMMRRYPTINVAAVNALGAVLAGLAVLPLARVLTPSLHDLVILALLGVLALALPFLLFLLGGRHVPPGEAGLLGLLDVVLGPLWVWLVFREAPGLGAVVGGGLILASVIWYLAPSLPALRAARS